MDVAHEKRAASWFSDFFFPPIFFFLYYSHKTMKDVLISLDTGELSRNIFAAIPQLYASVSSKQKLRIILNCVLIWILGINLSKTNLFHVLI